MCYVDFFKTLNTYRHLLTRQELQTLRGQAIAGHYEAARKGLATILMRKETENRSKTYATQAKSPM